jgi:hypothetical protein
MPDYIKEFAQEKPRSSIFYCVKTINSASPLTARYARIDGEGPIRKSSGVVLL